MQDQDQVRWQSTSVPGLLLLSIAIFWAWASPGVADDDPEEQVQFYPTYGYPDDDVWIIPMRARVHEPSDAPLRALARAARSEIADRAGLKALNEQQKQRYRDRVEAFIADNESGEQVALQFDHDPRQRRYALRWDDGNPDTDGNGLVIGTLQLSNLRANELLEAQGSTNGWLTFHAASDDHGGAGRLRLIPPMGVSVISDIDDTIKVTDIPSGERELLNNTFFREFQPAPCMVAMYRGMGEAVAFHYVSGGPWQMYDALKGFLFEPKVGFPWGSVHMKNVRSNPFESESYEDLWALLAGGAQQVTHDQKVAQISALIGHFPDRQFILIGDSGERDPEVFSDIRGLFADQIQEIRIRDLVNDRERRSDRLTGMRVISPEPDSAGSCLPD